MKIDEYKKISDNVQVPDVVWEGYQNAIKQIKMEKETDKNIVKISKWKNECFTDRYRRVSKNGGSN